MSVVITNLSVIPNPCKGEESFIMERFLPAVEMTLVLSYFVQYVILVLCSMQSY